MTYSRELLAAPLRQLSDVLRSIESVPSVPIPRSGTFSEPWVLILWREMLRCVNLRRCGSLTCLLFRQDKGLFPRGSAEQKFVCGHLKSHDHKNGFANNLGPEVQSETKGL